MITSEQAQELGYLLDPCFQIVNTAGKPVTNGYIEIYLHGTRVKYYAFSDWNGALHPFQIPLDSLGSNIVLADPANSYDVYVYNAFGSLLMSRYNVKVSAASGGSSGGLPAQYEAEHWLGQYGATQVLEGNERGQTLALPQRPDYQGDFIDHIDWGYINGDEVNEYPKYMYLKPGLYLVNCVIRFQQQRGTEVNRLDELLVYTGNGNANEDVAWQLDETGPLASGDRHCLKLTFIRKVLDEGESSPVDCNKILYFAPAPQVNWSDAFIQTLQIVKLDSKGGAGTQTYIPGDYISIIGNVISVTGVLPESATADFVQYAEYNTEIQNIHQEIDNLEITVQNATSQIVEQTTEIVTSIIEEVAPPMVTSIIERELAGVTGDFATKDELESATGNLQEQIDNIPAQVQSDWEENDPENPAYIQNKPDLSVYATKDELQSASSEIITIIETVTGNVPTGAVTHEELENATSVLQNEIDNIPAQVQSDWTQSATGEPDYIKNKPEVLPLVAGQNIAINEVNGEIVISAEGGQPTGDYVERDELENVTSQIESEIENVTSQIPSDVVTHAELEAATANIPAQVQSDWTESDSSDPSYIQNKPTELSLVEGTNIHITKSGNEVIISADNGATGAVTQSELATATANLQTEIETVTGDVIDTVTSMIPAAQVQSDWTESDTSDPSYIQNKPSEKTLVEGQNVHITASGDYIVISADGGQVTGDYVEHDELEAVTADVLDQATGAIPAQVQSDWTQTVTGDPSYIKHKPDTLPLVAGDNVTINEVNGEIVISAQGGVTGDFVETSELEAATAELQSEIETVSSNIPELPDEEEVEFEELDLSDYATAADVSALESELEAVTASIPSTDNLATKAEVAAATGDIQAEIETVSSMITPELPVVGGTGIGITETSTEITIAVTGDYVTPNELASATGDIQDEIENVTASIPELPDEEEVDFEEVDLSDYAPATAITAVEADIQTVSSAIPDTSDMATKTWVGNQGYLTSVPATYVTESELATATAAVEADIPVVTGFATKSELTSGLNGKQNTLTGITDVQVVQSLPASPVATVLYLIPEA